MQFGVLHGTSLAKLAAVLARHKGRSDLWGFDSFVGLPEEERGKMRPTGWKPGALSTSAGTSVEDAKRRVAQMLSRHGGVRRDRVHLVDGFYNVSLTTALAARLRAHGQARLVDVDCNIYVSAFQALDWVFTHGLARVGTIISYDDWWNVACTSPLLRQERNGI